MTPLHKEVKNLDSYIASIENFYSIYSKLKYKETVNKVFERSEYDTTEEVVKLKKAASVLRNEIKQLPLDMIRPGVVEQMNQFLSKKFKIKSSS